MNKNQKHLPYTYSKLIHGNRFVARSIKAKISDLETKIKRAAYPGSKTPKETVLDWRNQVAQLKTQVEYFDDEFCRFSLAQAVCGDEMVLIR